MNAIIVLHYFFGQTTELPLWGTPKLLKLVLAVSQAISGATLALLCSNEAPSVLGGATGPR